MRFYWGDQIPNFGDTLNGPLLEWLGIDYTHTNNHETGKYFCIGSIIRLAKNATILGSGIIREVDEIDPKCTIRFVRGPLTRDRVIEQGGDCPEIYGDPALLAPRFIQPRKKKYKVGFVPHYWNHNPGMIDRYKFLGWEFINVLNSNPIEVVQKITECEYIASSSLHGIIIAHAYGIPAAHVKFPGTKKIFGDGIKYSDYYASVGMKNVIQDASKWEQINFQTPRQLPDLDRIEEILREYS